MAALKAIHEIKQSGGQVTGFTSWCGGLPAPEFSNNPLGYKFSWSPRGVLLATQNAAKYRKNGKLVDIPGHQLLSSAKKVGLFPGFSFEGIPNRDSIKYIPQYGLGADIPTIFRGTLRYQV
jgi:saccharopine dehydrogenase-like NADP-dependent oxidoreductase